MFGKKQHGDLKKSYQKVLDPKKDTITRLKHLRVLLGPKKPDNYDVIEAKRFFETNYSNIYYIFYDVFINLESELKRPNKSHREELDGVLFIFEKILVLLPELIHKRWQFHSIGRILGKLLHHGNALKLRREGMRLFLVWYQILQENATKHCHQMFATLVPGLSQLQEAHQHNDGDTQDVKVGPTDISAILPPQPGEKVPDNITKCLLDSLVLFMVSEITKVEWENKQMQEFSFNFLFNYFKQYYLMKIFPEFSYQRSIYELDLTLPGAEETDREGAEGGEGAVEGAEGVDGGGEKDDLGEYQEVIIKWLTLYTHSSKKPDSAPSGFEEGARDLSDNEVVAPADAIPGSNVSTLSTSSSLYNDGSGSAAVVEDRSTPGYEIVKACLFSCRENINLVHELYRQAFYFSFKHTSAMRKVIAVYRDWLQSEERPVFMQDPPPPPPPPSDDVTVAQDDVTPGEDQLAPLEPSTRWYTNLDIVDSPYAPGQGQGQGCWRAPVPRLRNNSYLGAVGAAQLEPVLSRSSRLPPPHLNNGLQKCVRVFVSHVASVFFQRTHLLNNQVDMCKRVLNIYRHVVMKLHMERQTWEQLLLVLLKITSSVLKDSPPPDRDSSLGGRLASALFQTLIVTWIKANLNVFISAELWDKFLSVLSSLTQWEELIKEWAKTMETLTRLLAKNVYNLDVNDLPLDRLSEQKEKRRRAKTSTGLLNDRGRSSTSLLTHSDVMLRSPRSPRRQHDRQTVHVPLRDERGRKSEGALETSLVQRLVETQAERTRSLSGSPGDLPERHTAAPTLQRSSSDSHLHQYAPPTAQTPPTAQDAPPIAQASPLTEPGPGRDAPDAPDLERNDSFHEQSESFHEQSESFHEQNDSFHDHNDSFQEQLDILGAHPLTEDQDIRSMTESLTSAGGTDSASYASVDSNLHIASSLDTTLVEPVPEIPRGHADQAERDRRFADQAERDRRFAGRRGRSAGSYEDSEDAESELSLAERTLVGFGEGEGGQDEWGPSPRDALYPLRAELGAREKSESRSSSPGLSGRSSPAQSSLVEERLDLSGGKDSPTPDRESIHIDAVVDDQADMHHSVLECSSECRSVLGGGTVPGWTPEVCVVLWRRMLGALGDPNRIRDPNIHASVYEYLCELLDTLIRIRDNMSVTVDNMSSPSTPELLPPITIFSPWLVEALSLPAEYKRGRLLAHRLLCQMTLRRHDVISTLPTGQAPPTGQTPPTFQTTPSDVTMDPEHVAQFFIALHDGLTSTDMDVVDTVLRYCGPLLLSLGPPGTTLLIVDMVEAANNSLNAGDLQSSPRVEALSMLGSLVCYPHLFDSLETLDTLDARTGRLVPVPTAHIKDRLMTSLLASGKKEPAGLARCIALCSLGIYLYHELQQNSMHSKVSEAISTLTMTLRFHNKLVAQVACDVLYLLCDHIHIILQKMPSIPAKIIQSISATISSGLPTTDGQADSADERLTCSLMFCLLEWTMRVPYQLVMEAESGQKPLIYTVFKVLNQAVSGCSLSSISRSTLTLSDLAQADYDLENVKETQSCPTSPWSVQDVPALAEVVDEADTSSPSQTGTAVRTAARTVLNHIVNHFGHFPRGGGAARFNSSVQEFHDVPDLAMDDLKPDIFDLPNVQFFVLNSSVLISLIELPAWRDAPGGGMTAGMSTASTITRLIIRDGTGKYCWDSAVLYCPPLTDHTPSDLQDYVTSYLEDEDEGSISDRIADSFSFLRDAQHDELNKLLGYIGNTSRECLLRPGQPLNVPGPPPEGVTIEEERDTCQTVLVERQEEHDYIQQHQNDNGMVAREEIPMVIEEPASPFYLCRTLLSQLGFLSWEKRASFDLLKKSERLLRELKNIDNRYCRETHKVAVFYVGPGQEDKNSILSNALGSVAYENFVSGLGWEVDLETHCGYRGGLPNDKSCGDTTPYYATSTLEILFHCSSRMPGLTEDDRHRKLRHLGNDEVMIVWSEHSRDYRRGIVPTEFGDVLIIIYPLHNGLFRIQIDKKSEVPFFGPLFDGAIVGETTLPGLVRATALNAGRVKRSTMTYYRPFYEERSRYLSTIVAQHKQDSTFEEFAEQVFAPVIDPEHALPGTPLHELPFMLSTGSSLFDTSDTARDGQHSPRTKGSKDSELFLFPAAPVEKSAGRRLSFRNVRRLSSRSTSSVQTLAPPSDTSSPESPIRATRR